MFGFQTRAWREIASQFQGGGPGTGRGVSSFEEVVQAFQALDREGLSFQRIRLSVVQ